LIFDRLVDPSCHYNCGELQPLFNDWIAIHEATWPTWKPLLMRSDAGVPVLHCGVAARAIPRAMAGIDRMYF